MLPIRTADALLVDEASDANTDPDRFVVSLHDEGRWSAPMLVAWMRRPWRRPLAMHLARRFASRGITRVRAGNARLEPLARSVQSLLPREPHDLSMLDLDWTALGAQSLHIRWISTRLDAAVAEVRAGDRDVIVKQSFSPERARHEHRVLTQLTGVPRVLLWDAGRATIVMERANGISLDRLFAARDDTALREGIRAAGAWLATMQAGTRTSSDAKELFASILDTAVRDAHVMGRYEQRVVARLRAFAARPAFVAGHHGDYWPGNIFIDGARATVIDFEGFREGLPLEDVAYFLIRLDMLSRRFRIRARGLASTFFEGYGETPDPQALAFFTLTKGLRTLANDTGGNQPLPQRWWTRRTIRNAVLRALR